MKNGLFGLMEGGGSGFFLLFGGLLFIGGILGSWIEVDVGMVVLDGFIFVMCFVLIIWVCLGLVGSGLLDIFDVDDLLIFFCLIFFIGWYFILVWGFVMRDRIYYLRFLRF